VAAGIAGTCPSCSALVSTDARFCERCGTPLGRGAKTHDEPHTEELHTPERAERDATVRRPSLRRR
jgi:predicted amidophosphoribosyltransferase